MSLLPLMNYFLSVILLLGMVIYMCGTPKIECESSWLGTSPNPMNGRKCILENLISSVMESEIHRVSSHVEAAWNMRRLCVESAWHMYARCVDCV